MLTYQFELSEALFVKLLMRCLFLFAAFLLVACTDKVDSVPTARVEPAKDVLPGVGDLDRIRFVLGRSETNHSFSPKTATIDDPLSPLGDENVEASFRAALIPAVQEFNQSLVTLNNLDSYLPNIVSNLTGVLRQQIKELNNTLPTYPYYVTFSLLPLDTGTFAFVRDGYSYDDANIVRSEPAMMSLSAADYAESVTKNVRSIQEQGYKKRASLRNYLLGAFLTVVLRRDHTRFHFELAVGLNPRTIPFVRSTPQVDLKDITIPDRGSGVASTMALVRVDQELQQAQAPKMVVSFGGFSGFNTIQTEAVRFNVPTEEIPARWALDSVWQYLHCDSNQRAQPYLSGVVPPSGLPTALRLLGRTAAVDFRLRDIALQVERARVQKISLGLAPGLSINNFRITAGCFANASVDAQFQSEINKEIQKDLTDITNISQHPLALILRGFL